MVLGETEVNWLLAGSTLDRGAYPMNLKCAPAAFTTQFCIGTVVFNMLTTSLSLPVPKQLREPELTRD